MQQTNVNTSLLKNPWLRWSIFLLAWTGLAFLGYLFLDASLVSEPIPRRVHGLLVRWVLSLYLYGVAIPVVVVFSSRFPLNNETWKRNILLHLLAAILFTYLHTQLTELLARLFIGPFVPRPPNMPFRGPLRREIGPGLFIYIIRTFSLSFLFYWFIASASHVFDYYKKLRARELQATQLQSQLASAQLQALKNQLHPHFLFNTLNTISSLVYQDARAADKMIRQLSDLLRMTLTNANVQEVTLREELDFLDTYLEIMQTRYRKRLHVSQEIADEALNALAPNLAIQLLVENAIKHSVEKTAGEGHIRICAKKIDKKVQIKIIDNGPGLQESVEEAMQKGMGLRNTVKRLQQLYGERYRLEFENLDEGGLKVVLEVPFKMDKSGLAIPAYS